MKTRYNFFKSLRFRIMIFLILFGIIPAALSVSYMLKAYRNGAVAEEKENVREECRVLGNLLTKERFFEDSSSAVIDGKLELLANCYHGRIMVINRNLRIVSDTYHMDEGKTIVRESVIRCAGTQEETDLVRNGKLLEMCIPVISPGSRGLQGILYVSFSPERIKDTIDRVQVKGILQILLIILGAGLLSWFLSGVLVRPLENITNSIEDITDGYQNEELNVPDFTETERITEAFNKMVSRMRVLDQSRSEFVSNVSHELKTPMTSMKVLADSLVGQSGVPEELYQEFLRDIAAEIDRENRIITDLLTLVKMDKTVSDLNVAHQNINQLVEAILKRLHPIADQHSISLILETLRSVEADVDEIKFTSAISNLVENAIKYNVEEGWVRVTLDADHQYFYVKVADSGLGIPEDSIERIFERFYRVDKSHSREIGGSGLGLSITRSVITMHHGSIKVFSKEGEGTTFTVRIPLSYIPKGGAQ